MQDTFFFFYNEAKKKGIIYGTQKNKAGLELEIIAMKANLSEGGQSYKTCPIKSLIPLWMSKWILYLDLFIKEIFGGINDIWHIEFIWESWGNIYIE